MLSLPLSLSLACSPSLSLSLSFPLSPSSTTLLLVSLSVHMEQHGDMSYRTANLPVSIAVLASDAFAVGLSPCRVQHFTTLPFAFTRTPYMVRI